MSIQLVNDMPCVQHVLQAYEENYLKIDVDALTFMPDHVIQQVEYLVIENSKSACSELIYRLPASLKYLRLINLSVRSACIAHIDTVIAHHIIFDELSFFDVKHLEFDYQFDMMHIKSLKQSTHVLRSDMVNLPEALFNYDTIHASVHVILRRRKADYFDELQVLSHELNNDAHVITFTKNIQTYLPFVSYDTLYSLKLKETTLSSDFNLPKNLIKLHVESCSSDQLPTSLKSLKTHHLMVNGLFYNTLEYLQVHTLKHKYERWFLPSQLKTLILHDYDEHLVLPDQLQTLILDTFDQPLNLSYYLKHIELNHMTHDIRSIPTTCETLILPKYNHALSFFPHTLKHVRLNAYRFEMKLFAYQSLEFLCVGTSLLNITFYDEQGNRTYAFPSTLHTIITN